jgi:hypothetical protein
VGATNNAYNILVRDFKVRGDLGDMRVDGNIKMTFEENSKKNVN